mgnify:CR=1 FL=1
MADLRTQATMKSWVWLVLIAIILIVPVLRRFFILWFIVFPVGWIPVFLIVIILVGVKHLRRRDKAARAAEIHLKRDEEGLISTGNKK